MVRRKEALRKDVNKEESEEKRLNKRSLPELNVRKEAGVFELGHWAGESICFHGQTLGNRHTKGEGQVEKH